MERGLPLLQTDEGARALWQQIKAQADDVATVTPDPLKVINYAGRINTDAERIETVKHQASAICQKPIICALS